MSSPRPSLHLSHRFWLSIILLGHGLLALAYSVIIPPWEAHDEWAHYRYAAYIAETGQLPHPGERLTTEFEFDEASQPPLYYLLAAAPMLVVDTKDGYTPEVNPYVSGETAQTGVNMAVHDPEVEAFPWRGTILALHLGRFVSILISLLALVVTYRLVRFLTPDRPEIALLTTAFQAFAPQFVFLSAVMTNDILVILLTPLLIYLSLRLIEEGPRPRLTLAAGLVAGLTLLTKYLALAVVPLALVAFLWGAWRHRHRPGVARQLVVSGFLFLGMLALAGGVLFGRNLQTTGVWIPRDPVSQQSLIAGLGQGSLDIDWALLPEALRNGFMTYWTSFGWGNVAPAAWVFDVWLVISLVGVAGTGLWLVREKDARSRRLTAFLAVFVFAGVSFPLLRELLHDSPFLRGRYMLSTLPVAAWVIIQGWATIATRAWRWLRWVLLAWPLGLSLILPFTLLHSAYAPPPRLAHLPAEEGTYPIQARFDDAAILQSARVWPEDEARVGQGVAVSLYWKVLGRTEEPYALSIQIVGAGDQPYASLLTYPGRGNAATTVWQPGTEFEDTYWLVIRPELPLPTSARVLVNFFNPEAEPAYLPVFDSQGHPAGDSVYFGSLRLSPQEDVPPQTGAPAAVRARFGDALQLTSVRVEEGPQHAGGTFPVWLAWQALGPAPDDLLLSLQLLDEKGAWVAGVDGPVSEILLPPHWRAGDVLDTTRWFLLPPDLTPGRYRLMAALYRSGDLSRLPAYDGQGEPLPNGLYPLAEIDIVGR